MTRYDIALEPPDPLPESTPCDDCLHTLEDHSVTHPYHCTHLGDDGWGCPCGGFVEPIE